MEWKLYFALSILMFLEFAVWGAWYPVLAARLLGPLKFSGEQTGWIYAALPMACIVMPLLGTACRSVGKHRNHSCGSPSDRDLPAVDRRLEERLWVPVYCDTSLFTLLCGDHTVSERIDVSSFECQ